MTIPITIDSNKTSTNNVNYDKKDIIVDNDGTVSNDKQNSTIDNIGIVFSSEEDSTIDNNGIIFDDDLRKSHWFW